VTDPLTAEPMRAGSIPVDVRLEGVHKSFGDTVAVDGVDLDVYEGEFFSFLGPSGSGKTTCLRMIAGFPSRSQSWPISGFSTHWFSVAWHNPEIRSALATSIKAAAGATVIALTLGSFAAFAVHRFRFFGRETVSFLLVLPLALPGIVTGMALNSAINFGGQIFGLSFSLFTIIVGHATFCIVVVYNNVVARLRRTSDSIVEASMDLGADGWQTFRYITLPGLSTALVAGGLLAFALSFDEIIVTNFTSGSEITLPKWIFNNLRLPTQRPR